MKIRADWLAYESSWACRAEGGVLLHYQQRTNSRNTVRYQKGWCDLGWQQRATPAQWHIHTSAMAHIRTTHSYVTTKS